MEMHDVTERGVWLRDYIETNFKTDSGWICRNSFLLIDTAFVAGEISVIFGGPAYWPVKRYKRIWNRLTFRTWKLPFRDVFRNIQFVWVDSDIVLQFPSWVALGLVYKSYMSGIGSSEALDKWLKLDADDGDWSQPSATFGIRCTEKNSSNVYYLDFPLFAYIDHVRVR